MKNYEKSSFYKIFLGYFISAAIFILLLGFLYFQQHKNIILQQTAMNMHQYLLQLKDSDFTHKQIGYSYRVSKLEKVEKKLPKKQGQVYFKAFTNKFIINIDAKIVDAQISKLKYFTISLQILLIVIFSLISYILAKRSLQPMVDIVSHMDRFIGDLIHDINTPIASILLNTQMLKKDIDNSGYKKLKRIEDSANNIMSLYENLEILIDPKVLIKEKIDLVNIIDKTVSIYKNIYPNITFELDYDNTEFITNEIAMTRILDNIISNGCKYSNDNNPMIKIICKDNLLIVKDNGKGIKFPQKVFDRNYTENQNGYGIGMHIVYRLCSELNHKIKIESKEQIGTTVSITF